MHGMRQGAARRRWLRMAWRVITAVRYSIVYLETKPPHNPHLSWPPQALYCSRGCQTRHWRAGHKAECRAAARAGRG